METHYQFAHFLDLQCIRAYTYFQTGSKSFSHFWGRSYTVDSINDMRSQCGSIWAPPPPPPPRRVQKFQGKIASLQYFPCRWFRWPFLHHSSHTLQQYHLNSYILQWSLYSHRQCAHGNNKMPANLSVTNRSHSLLMTVEDLESSSNTISEVIGLTISPAHFHGHRGFSRPYGFSRFSRLQALLKLQLELLSLRYLSRTVSNKRRLQRKRSQWRTKVQKKYTWLSIYVP